MYNYYMPTRIIFELNSSGKLGELLEKENKKNILVVTDKGILNAGLLSPMLHSLENSNIKYEMFDEVEPNPKTSTIRKGVQKFSESDFDAIVGFGGGSSIDTAKAIAVMATNEGEILDYEGVGKIVNDPLYLVAIPTTAGTGSEVTASTVITDENTLFKAAVVSPKVFPNLAILDASLTLKCPPGITSSTGMDALTHAIESYISKQSDPISGSIALHAITLISNNLSKAYFYGTDLESRERMLEASMLAGLAFSQTRLGNVHAISQSFGGVFDIPHGIANAVLLPYILKFNAPACLDKMVDIAKAMGISTANESDAAIADKVVETIVEWNKAFDIPNNTKVLGVDLAQIDKLISDSMRSGNVLVNPRLTTAKDVEKLIKDSHAGIL
ncbi:iron-containing alcohol dehydrogenase [Bacillus sp. Marseille-P3661]|uniref:iron-containing alcohol dehydrogenase n=1 Tax=Bacillus sp. Marseille-P3661 TaxID=1936234 RepID=UPI000C848CAA|nr:iron-containing alcohol dehydrogenase [Bacillus sp. Marseille-P3661]